MDHWAGLHKAAVFLASMPREQAVELLARLARDEAHAVATEIGRLGEIDTSQRESVYQEFAAESIVSRNRHWTMSPPFSFLRHLENHELKDLIAAEHPQTIALVASFLPREQATALLASLSADLQADVIWRIATLGQPNSQIICEVELALQSELIKKLHSAPGADRARAA